MNKKGKLLLEKGYKFNFVNMYYEKGCNRISLKDVENCTYGELEVRLILKETDWD